MVVRQAFLTNARDDQIVQGYLKPIGRTQATHERLDFLLFHAREPATRVAEEVRVCAVFPDQLVATLPVAWIQGGDQVEFLQKLQSSIDGGNIHAGTEVMHPGVDVFGGGVPLDLVHDA